MNSIRDFFEALRYAVRAGIDKYRFVRLMQNGHCPDDVF